MTNVSERVTGGSVSRGFVGRKFTLRVPHNAGKWKSKIFLILLFNLMIYIKIISFTLCTGLIIKMLHIHVVCIARQIFLSGHLMNLLIEESHDDLVQWWSSCLVCMKPQV